MKNLWKVACVVTIFSFVAGCAMAMAPVNGQVYQNVKGPIAYGQNGVSAKTGEACAKSILGIVATGDASISAAMVKGGISNVTSIDHRSKNILGVYAKFCVVVKGN